MKRGREEVKGIYLLKKNKNGEVEAMMGETLKKKKRGKFEEMSKEVTDSTTTTTTLTGFVFGFKYKNLGTVFVFLFCSHRERETERQRKKGMEYVKCEHRRGGKKRNSCEWRVPSTKV